jgi:hypothetical protein
LGDKPEDGPTRHDYIKCSRTSGNSLGDRLFYKPEDGHAMLNTSACLRSPNGKFELVLEENGYLKLWNLNNNHNLWATNQQLNQAPYVQLWPGMRPIVITGFPPGMGKRMMYGLSINTSCSVHVVLRVQDDGNMVLYDAGEPKWATHTGDDNNPTKIVGLINTCPA